MSKVYRSAQGKMIDMDKIRIQNEETIAVGNMHVNARGDELGDGGKVVRNRNEVMDEHYKTNAVYTKENVNDRIHARNNPAPVTEKETELKGIDPLILEQDAIMNELNPKPKVRGALADAVAKAGRVDSLLKGKDE